VAISSNKRATPLQNYSKLLIGAGVLISFAYTPWINKDSLAIPKQTLLFITASYFLPKIIFEVSTIYRLKYGKLILYPSGLILLHLILVMIFSGAPIEQQIYGRDGRLLGIITFFSSLIIFFTSIRYFNKLNLKHILAGIFITSLGVSVYAVLQSYGLDIFKWESRTNLVISTLGNPNYVSAFVAMAFFPSIAFVKRYKYQYYYQVLLLLFALFVIYRTQSIQGFVSIFFAGNIFLLMYMVYRHKKILPYFVIYLFASLLLAISGSLGHGPFSRFLYKVSIESRGDFWRSAWRLIQNNPIFGVGLDSFGENFLQYRDQRAANHTFAEFTDSAHNYLLDYAAFGGVFLAILNICLILLTIFFFIKLQQSLRQFDLEIISIFAAWCAIQATLIISPISLTTLFWSNIFSGSIIGVGIRALNIEHKLDNFSHAKVVKLNTNSMVIAGVLALLLMLPLINTDRLYLKSLNTSDGNLGIKVVNSFPRSSQKYATVGRLLHESAQYKYSLEVARNSIESNSKNVTGYALIMINPLASYEERQKAKIEVLSLDPFNKEVPGYQIQ